MDSPELVLASASPRRQELLLSLGLEFSIQSADIEETTTASDPAEIVTALSLAKAQAVVARLNPPERGKRVLVLAADTIVVFNSLVLGKPQSVQEAYEMLMLLSGQEHQVFTGVTLLELPGARSRSLYRASSVFFRKLEPAEAAFYAAGPEPIDKAGAYALQGTAGAFVERVEGCYSNVIGLPLSDVVLLLREFGVSVLGCAQVSPP
jgi:septum formation protein